MKLTKETIQQLGESGIYEALENERKSVFSTYSYAISEKDVNEIALKIIKQEIAGFNNAVDNFSEKFQQKLEKRIKAKIKIALSNKNDPDKAYEIITKYIEGRFNSPQSYRQAERSFDRLNSFFERNEYETSSLLFEMLLKNNDVFRENVRFIINEKASQILTQILTQELKNRKYTICDNKTLNQAIRKYIGVYEGNLEAELNALVQSKPASNIKIKIRISPTGYNPTNSQPQSKGTTTNNTTVKPNDSKIAEGRSQPIVKTTSPKSAISTNSTKASAQRSTKSFYDLIDPNKEYTQEEYDQIISDNYLYPEELELLNYIYGNGLNKKHTNKLSEDQKTKLKKLTTTIKKLLLMHKNGVDPKRQYREGKSPEEDNQQITNPKNVDEEQKILIKVPEKGKTSSSIATKILREGAEAIKPEGTQTSEEVIKPATTPVSDAITEVPEESGETAQEPETKAVTISDTSAETNKGKGEVPDEPEDTQTPEKEIEQADTPVLDANTIAPEESDEATQERPEMEATAISDTDTKTIEEESKVPYEPETTQTSEEVIKPATDAITEVPEESGETAQEPETKAVTISDTSAETDKGKGEVSDEPEDTQTSEEVIEQAGTPVPDAITEVPEESGETAQESETKAVTISDARTTEIEETPEEETATKVEPENNSSIEASLDKETIVSEDQATEEGTNKEASSNAITKEEQGSTVPKRRKYVKYNSNSLYQLIGSDKEYANTKTDIIINTLTNEEQDFINRLFTNGLGNPPADKISGKDKNKIVTIVGKIRRRIESNDTLIDIIISELPPEKMELITKYGNGTITDEDKEKYKNLTFEISEKLNKINPFYDLIDPKKEYTQEEYDIIINTLSDKELTFINSKYTSGYDKKPTSTFNSAEYIKLTSIIIKVKRRLSTYCTSKSFYEYIDREKKVPREYIDILINKLSPNKKKELNDRFENGFDQPPTSIPNKSNIVIHNRIIIILRGRIFSLTTLNELINKDGKYTEQQIKIVLSVLSVKEKEFLIEIFGNELNNIQKPTSGKISQKLANITMKIRSLLKELEQTDEEQFLEKNGKNKRRKNRKNKRRKNRPFYELLGGNIVLINLLLEKQGQDRKSVVNKLFGNGLDKPSTISLDDEGAKIYRSITQTIKSQIPNYPSNQLDEHNFYEQINQIITKPRSIDNLQRIIEHSLTEDEITIILKRYSYGLNNPPTTILDDDTYKEYINIVIKFKEGIKKSKSKSFHDEVDEERKYSNDEFNAALNSLTPLQKEAIIKVYGPDLGGSIPYKASQKDIHNCDNAITKVKKFLESGKGAMQAHGNNSRSRDFYYKETTTFLKQPPEIPLQDILETLEASIIYHTCIERYSYEDLREILDMHEEAIQKIEENALGKLNDYIIAHNGIGEETEKDSKKVLQKKL